MTRIYHVFLSIKVVYPHNWQGSKDARAPKHVARWISRGGGTELYASSAKGSPAEAEQLALCRESDGLIMRLCRESDGLIMRCPDCNKFASFDDSQDPEAEDGEIQVHEDGTATYSAQVRRVLVCIECGTELKDFTFEHDHDLKAEDIDGEDIDGNGGAAILTSTCSAEDSDGEHEWNVDTVDATADSTDRQRVGKNGKPLKGTDTFLGYSLEVTCACDHCGESFSFTVNHEGETAAAFEECC